MTKRTNEFIPIAEAALAVVLNNGGPVTPRVLHDVLTGDVEFLSAMLRAFNTEQGINAMRVLAVKRVLDEYGEAIGVGRDAEHVAKHDVVTKARRLALVEEKRAELDKSLARIRNEFAQMTLDGDLERAVIEEAATRATT